MKVLWSELLPYEFKERLSACPVVYLPLGICEPHGQISAFGLDTLKAEWLCVEAAKRVGGIVAPSLGYHIHESGYHARWLEEVVGEEQAHMTGMPPHVLLHFFLYQLRAFVGAGFQSIVILTGHGGGNELDLRRVSDAFSRETGVAIIVSTDAQLVRDQYQGDHAGRYEISQLMFLRPELIDFSQLWRQTEVGAGGRLALGEDATEASGEQGARIMEACLAQLCEVVTKQSASVQHKENLIKPRLLSYEETENIWQQAKFMGPWNTSLPHADQKTVSETSQWKFFEYHKL